MFSVPMFNYVPIFYQVIFFWKGSLVIWEVIFDILTKTAETHLNWINPLYGIISSGYPIIVEQLCPPGSTFQSAPQIRESYLGNLFQVVCFKKNFPEKYVAFIFIILLVVLGKGEFFIPPFKSEKLLLEQVNLTMGQK